MPVWATDHQSIILTEAAIKSIKAGNPNAEVLIVDNGSTVGSGALREWADIYICNKVNLGYAKAVNQGLKLSGEIVAVANNDIRVSPNWWDVSKKIVNKGSVHFRMIPYDQPFNLGDKTWEKGKERWCSSSFFVMLNRQLYDEHFLNSLDDWDYWKRFRQKGLKTVYTNKAEYQHLDSFTQEKVPERDVNDQRNRDYFVKKWGCLPEEDFEKQFPGQLSQNWKPMP